MSSYTYSLMPVQRYYIVALSTVFAVYQKKKFCSGLVIAERGDCSGFYREWGHQAE